ncbi:MAG: MaoC family dehydratase [Xanthobacteraceae bacterium]|nr:MaoC family dehydratase [Xanthobacteraceae bacterium]
MSYFEDIKPGDHRSLGSFSFTAENIKAFAARFDPQPFHLDEEAGRNSIFGGLAASGWHVSSAWMKMMVAEFQREAAARALRGEPPVAAGPSPGFRNLKWIKPVLAGDTVSYRWEAVSTRVSEKRPEWGLVNSLNTGTNQHSVLVFSFEATVFMPRKPAQA